MPTHKEIRARLRIASAQKNKKIRRSNFLSRLANRRGMETPNPGEGDYICQQGHHQLVSEVEKAGGVYFYKSASCSGCDEGNQHNRRLKRKGNPIPEEVLGCGLVMRQHLVSIDPVEVGDLVAAKNPLEI